MMRENELKKNLVLDSMEPSIEELCALAEEETEEAITPDQEAEDLGYIGDSLQLYIAEMGRIPMLTPEQEKHLGRKILEGGEAAHDAKERLVLANLRLALHYAKKYKGCGVELEDLNTMAQMGLMTAAEKFDYRRGCKFSTYATWWIKQAISRGIAGEGAAIRIPVHMNEAIRLVRKTQETLRNDFGQNPTVTEIAESSGLTEKAVREALAADYTVTSMDTQVGDDGDTTMADFIADQNAADPEEEAEKAVLKETVRDILDKLDPKEARVLELRHGLGNRQAMTLEQVANLPEFGVSRERIRQIEEKAYRKIRRNPRMMEALREFAA